MTPRPIPPGYALRHTDARLTYASGKRIPPIARSRFRWVARWKMSRARKPIVPSYRFEVVREKGRWVVVVMQNVLIEYS